MENTDENNLSEQGVALLKLLELGKAEIAKEQVKTMEEVFKELDKPD